MSIQQKIKVHLIIVLERNKNFIEELKMQEMYTLLQLNGWLLKGNRKWRVWWALALHIIDGFTRNKSRIKKIVCMRIWSRALKHFEKWHAIIKKKKATQ
jgi:hypothetical protein